MVAVNYDEMIKSLTSDYPYPILKIYCGETWLQWLGRADPDPVYPDFRIGQTF
ncbi:hypothetical protein LTR56_028149, partial [Elasticomyces elasticus]